MKPLSRLEACLLARTPLRETDFELPATRVDISGLKLVCVYHPEFGYHHRSRWAKATKCGRVFLWRRTDDNLQAALTPSITSGDGVQDDFLIFTNFEMRIRPKRQNIDGPQVRYRSHELGEELEAPIVNDGETFLFITRWEDLGNTDPIEGPARKAQMWVLDAAGYDAVAGGSTLYDEAVQINLATHGSDEETMLNAGNTIAMYHLYKDRAAVLSQPFTTEWDEMRYGDSIDDIPAWFYTCQYWKCCFARRLRRTIGDVDGNDFFAVAARWLPRSFERNGSGRLGGEFWHARSVDSSLDRKCLNPAHACWQAWSVCYLQVVVERYATGQVHVWLIRSIFKIFKPDSCDI